MMTDFLGDIMGGHISDNLLPVVGHQQSSLCILTPDECPQWCDRRIYVNNPIGNHDHHVSMILYPYSRPSAPILK